MADTRLAKINEVAATTGDDPDLDTVVLRLHTETEKPAAAAATRRATRPDGCSGPSAPLNWPASENP